MFVLPHGRPGGLSYLFWGVGMEGRHLAEPHSAASPRARPAQPAISSRLVPPRSAPSCLARPGPASLCFAPPCFAHGISGFSIQQICKLQIYEIISDDAEHDKITYRKNNGPMVNSQERRAAVVLRAGQCNCQLGNLCSLVRFSMRFNIFVLPEKLSRTIVFP